MDDITIKTPLSEEINKFARCMMTIDIYNYIFNKLNFIISPIDSKTYSRDFFNNQVRNIIYDINGKMKLNESESFVCLANYVAIIERLLIMDKLIDKKDIDDNMIVLNNDIIRIIENDQLGDLVPNGDILVIILKITLLINDNNQLKKFLMYYIFTNDMIKKFDVLQYSDNNFFKIIKLLIKIFDNDDEKLLCLISSLLNNIKHNDLSMYYMNCGRILKYATKYNKHILYNYLFNNIDNDHIEEYILSISYQLSNFDNNVSNDIKIWIEHGANPRHICLGLFDYDNLMEKFYRLYPPSNEQKIILKFKQLLNYYNNYFCLLTKYLTFEDYKEILNRIGTLKDTINRIKYKEDLQFNIDNLNRFMKFTKEAELHIANLLF